MGFPSRRRGAESRLVVVVVGDAARIDGQRGCFTGSEGRRVEDCFRPNDWRFSIRPRA